MATYYSQIIVAEATAEQLVLTATTALIPVPAIGTTLQVSVDGKRLFGTVKAVHQEITQTGPIADPLRQIVHSITIA